jgi:hypothetical protein
MKITIKQVKIISLVGIILFPFLSPLSVFAIDTAFYSSNDILFSGEDAASDCSTNTVTASLSLTDTPELKNIFQLLINGGMNTGQAAAVMGNMYAESSFNSDRHEVGNDIGYGLVQWSFGRRTNLENFAKQKGVPVSDVAMQIEFLLNEYNDSYKSRLDTTAFKDGTDIAASTESWMKIFEAPKMSPANDPAALNSKRIPAAVAVYGFYKSLAPSTTVTSSGCNATGNGAVAGNIVATALNLALTSPVANGKTQKSDARDTYQIAKPQYNPSVDWTDCGGFVSTVMKASGVDPNYPIGTGTQAAYVKSHPEKYTIITNPAKDGSNLQPGDILVSTQVGHTILYTGQAGTPYADASLGDRVPSVRPSSLGIWMLNNGAIVARVIK